MNTPLITLSPRNQPYFHVSPIVAGGGLFENARHAPPRVSEWTESARVPAFSRPGFVSPSSEAFYRAMEAPVSSSALTKAVMKSGRSEVRAGTGIWSSLVKGARRLRGV